MTAQSRLPFDPDSPGARKLIAAARAAKPVDIVMTNGMYVRANEVHAPGDRLTAPKGLAEQLIASGAAARLNSRG